MNEKKKRNGFFGSLGDSIDQDLKNSREYINEGTTQVKHGFREVFGIEEEQDGIGNIPDLNDDGMSQVIRFLMSRIESIGEPVGKDFNYASVLRWVKDNHIGNKFYMVKRHNTKNNVTYLFVFFGYNDIIKASLKDPMVCFICKEFPSSIDDLFNGKQVFIQKFE